MQWPNKKGCALQFTGSKWSQDTFHRRASSRCGLVGWKNWNGSRDRDFANEHPTQASSPLCLLEQDCNLSAGQSPTFQMWLRPTSARRAAWLCSLGHWRPSTALASPLTLEKHHFIESTLIGLLGTAAAALAHCKGKKVPWQRVLLGLGCGACSCKVLSISPASSSWHILMLMDLY